MNSYRGGLAVKALSGCVAVLLSAGAWSAATIGPSEPTTIVAGGRAGATGLGAATLVDDPRAAAPTTVTAPPPATGPGSTVAPLTTTTTRRPAPASTTSTATSKPPAASGAPANLPPIPWPTSPPPTGLGRIQPASAWSGGAWGTEVRLRMEPVAPVAGQPVTFTLDWSSPEPCCVVMASFGDGSGFSLNGSATCADLSTGARTVVKTHTLAAPGSYKLSLDAIANFPCQQLVGPGLPNPPEIHSVQLTGCIGVGPGPAAQKGCSPFPDFPPDFLVSPIIDPFCEVRSDCTKASTPRPGWND